MSEAEYSPEAEAEALDQWRAAHRKLKEEGIDGAEMFHQTLPLWEKYEAIRKQGELEGWIENRDAAMLGRGTYRGIAITLGILFAFLTVRADTPFEGRYIFGVLGLSCLYLVWRLGRIPYLGEEDKID